MAEVPSVPAELERYEAAYRSGVRLPWDLDGPAPFVVALEQAGRFLGQVLDAGCGTGENALYLAALGHSVTGVDCAPTALARAREKAAKRGLHVRLVETDACELPEFRGHFDTVLDSGLFHNLTEADQTRYVAALHRSCRIGATVHVFCMSDDPRNWDDVPWEPSCGRQGISREHLLRYFEDGWTVEEVSTESMTVAVPHLGDRERHFLLLRAKRR